MKSIKTKFILIMLTCLLLSCGTIGAAGLFGARTVIEHDSAQIMNLLCMEKAQVLNTTFEKIEQAVMTLATYAINQIDDPERFRCDAEYRVKHSEAIETVAINAANNTEGAIAVYVRYNPDFAGNMSGMFYSQTAESKELQKRELTDFSIYSEEDVEYTGWYYIPVRNGKPTWMSPYYNKNIHIQMISYVIPIEKDGVLIGAVGMDINFELIQNIVEETQVYKTGYAYLVDGDANILTHKDYEMYTPLASMSNGAMREIAEIVKQPSDGINLLSYTYQNVDKKMVYCDLKNGMKFILTAYSDEIDAAEIRLIKQILFASFFIGAIFLSITAIMTGKLVKPLIELTEAAKKVAAGDLNVSFHTHSKDEVGVLVDSFRQTVEHLQQYIAYINKLAYKDALTGAKNKTAYLEMVEQLDEQIKLKQPEFAVAVFDINNLKMVNDTYGHDFGDIIIMNACRLICQVFRRSPVYRIGGDEFVSILENSDYINYLGLMKQLEKEIEEYNKNQDIGMYISIARGIAIFNSETDYCYQNVFKRADDLMYLNKAETKRKRLEQK